MMSKVRALLKLQNIESDILWVIAAFCSSHNIRWWLDGGTCLGAVPRMTDKYLAGCMAIGK